jgi:hypothetical protein
MGLRSDFVGNLDLDFHGKTLARRSLQRHFRMLRTFCSSTHCLAAKLSVARVFGNEQKLWSAGILSLQHGNAGFSVCLARAKALSVSEIT